MTVDAQGKKTE